MKITTPTIIIAALAPIIGIAAPVGHLEVYEIVIPKSPAHLEFNANAQSEAKFLEPILAAFPKAIIRKSKCIPVEINKITRGVTGYTISNEAKSEFKIIGSDLQCCGLKQEGNYTRILINYRASSLLDARLWSDMTKDEILTDERDLNTQVLLPAGRYETLGSLNLESKSRHFIVHFSSPGPAANQSLE